jgi:cytochrome P450
MSADGSPPTPKGGRLLGHGFAFARDPVRAMERWAEAGDLVELSIPGGTMYQVTGPEHIEEILVENSGAFSIGPNQETTFEGVEDDAVTSATGDRWKRLRSAMHPVFTRASVEQYADSVGPTTRAFLDRWDDGEHVDLAREMRLLTVNVLADAMLGVDVRGDEAVFMDAADSVIEKLNFRRPGMVLPDWVPTLADRRFERRVRRLDDYVEGVLADCEPSEDGENVCSLLLAAHERGELSFTEVRDNLVALLLAGHESPSTALTHAWRLLADHPDVADALHEEHRTVASGAVPSVEDYDDLDRTRNVVRETLRLYPPTTGVNRQSTERVTLGGYDLPAGAQFLIPQWVPHRDERFWDAPETFDPGRWERDADRPRYAYFPFSGGPRNCIGTRFARLELVLALSTLVGHLEPAVAVDGELSFTPSLQLRPTTDMTATVCRRDTTASA